MPNISEKVVVLSELTDGISVVLSELTDNVDNINNELNNLNYYANYDKEFYEKQPLTFKSSVANAQVRFKSNEVTGTLYYSYDNVNWDTYTDGTFININNKIHFRGNLINDYENEFGIGTFELSANAVVEGNIMSLIYNDNFINQITIPYEWVFYALFYNCTSLINASNLILPAITLTAYCYDDMFAFCTSLVKAPELPATTLANDCYGYMFSNCTSLIKAPELPAITLDEYCYEYMFVDCTSLVEAPELPATTLANDCYINMFRGCTSLVKAPELPATTLTEDCYYEMFSNCTSLAKAPELPATILANYCYGYMFASCTSLAKAPELPATTLANDCYHSMFKGCASLKEAPELPAQTLISHCYNGMFKACTSLKEAPELPAQTLISHCYDGMFNSCSKLNYIKALFTTTPDDTYTQNWVSGVAATGLFIKSDDAEWNVTGINGVPTGWTVLTESSGPTNIDYYLQYLTIEAITPGTVTIYNNDYVGPVISISYSTDNGTTWTSITTPSSEVSLKTLAVGEKILFKGNNTSYNRGLIFGGTAQTKVYGNIMSLLYGDNFVGQITLDSEGNNFTNLFCNYTNLISAENLVLPATTLAKYCYYYMFGACTSLTKAPELPATTLVNSCYYHMFHNCTSLVEAPELPATSLADYCYCAMFSNCTSLTKAPELPATTLAGFCYDSMFYCCTSLVKAPELPATSLSYLCYQGMFQHCTSLTKAPELHATTLIDNCYSGMFSHCTSLTEAPELPATTLVNYCYFNMFCGCTSLTKAPELPATTLVDGCYTNMFRECTSLTYIKALFTTTPGNTYTQDWVLNVAPKGRFIKSKLATWELTGNTGVPNGWEIGEPVYEKLIGDDKNNLYIEKEGSVYPINHPDLSTQPSLLPQRFGVFPMYEILCPYSEEENDFDTSLIPSNAIIIEGSVFGNGYCESLNSYWGNINNTRTLVITNLMNDFTPEYALVRYYSNKSNKYGYSK